MSLDLKQQPKSSTTSTGAGAAEGLKAVSGQRGGEPTRSDKDAVSSPSKPSADKINHPGSEPLHDRTTEHESGYGGKGAEPRVSSDERESPGTDGSLRSESNKR